VTVRYLWVFSWVAIAGVQAAGMDGAMDETFYRSSQDNPVRIEAAPIAIRLVERLGTLVPAKPAGGGDAYMRPFANEQLNSRVQQPLPAGSWAPRWQAELGYDLHPAFILLGGGRILVQGLRQWRLFDGEGKPVASGDVGPSDVFLDAEHSLFYLADRHGFVAARRLSDGTEAFVLSAYFGTAFQRTAVARRGQHLTIASVERPVDPHGEHEPNLSVIEVQDLGDPLEVSETGHLRSAKRVTNLMRPTVLFLTALQNETLAIATRNWIYLADKDLEIRTALQGEFVPIALSLDESMRMYLVVESEEQRRLWAVTPNGEKMVLPLPAEFQAAAVPPIVGYDHRIYMVSRGDAMAVSQEGKLVWQRPAGGAIGGAVVTADNQLLVAAGSEVAAFDAEGKRRVLWASGGEELKTPPVLNAKGELLVASDGHLFSLASKASAAH
jgi:hypothetical protein